MAKYKGFKEFHQHGVESRWFTVYDIFPGVRAIFEPYHFQEVISYLIEGEERALLFDSGMGIGNMRSLVDSLTDKPVTLVLSHSHFDHAGGAWQFGPAYLGNVPRCIKLLEEGYSLPQEDENRSEAAFSLKGERWFDPASFSVRPCNALPLTEGQVFELGGRSLRVLTTPGHSEDGVMLADDANALLFTGDTVYPGPLYAFLEGESSAEIYLNTLSNLAEPFSSYTLLCSHNAPAMEGTALGEIAGAFRLVLSGSLEGTAYMGHKCYIFDNYSIVL